MSHKVDFDMQFESSKIEISNFLHISEFVTNIQSGRSELMDIPHILIIRNPVQSFFLTQSANIMLKMHIEIGFK